MKRKKLSAVLFAMAAVSLITLSACAEETEEVTEEVTEAMTEIGEPYVPVSTSIALVTPDTQNDYWNAFLSSAVKETEELNSAGSDIELQSLIQEGDSRLSMIENIEDAVDMGVDYIIFAAPNAETYTNALQEAVDKGIQIVYAETKASAAGILFGPDNYSGAYQVGEYLLEKLDEAGVGKGLIGIIDMVENNDPYKDRIKGFQAAFNDSTFNLEEPVSCNGDKEQAAEIANTLMDKGAVALFAAGAAASEGLASSEGEESVLKIGWDWFEECSDYVEKEMLTALVSGDPSLMGTYVVDAVVAIENKETLSDVWIDTGIRLFEAGTEVRYD